MENPPPELPLKTRAKDYEIDLLLEKAGQLSADLQATLARLRETLRTHQEGADAHE